MYGSGQRRRNRLHFDCPRDPPFSTITEETVQAEQASSHCAQGCTTIRPSLNEAIDFNKFLLLLNQACAGLFQQYLVFYNHHRQQKYVYVCVCVRPRGHK